MDPARRLVYRFFALPYHQRLDVVRTLGLIEPGESAEPPGGELERFRRCFRRARDKGALGTLWTEVERLHADGDPTQNPFAAASGPEPRPDASLGAPDHSTIERRPADEPKPKSAEADRPQVSTRRVEARPPGARP